MDFSETPAPDPAEIDMRIGGIGVLLWITTAVVICLNCTFSCQERGALAKINAWRTSQGQDSISTLRGVR